MRIGPGAKTFRALFGSVHADIMLYAINIYAR